MLALQRFGSSCKQQVTWLLLVTGILFSDSVQAAPIKPPPNPVFVASKQVRA